MTDIDFVIAWVDGSDPEWRKRKNSFIGKEDEDDREVRYRDWGTLPYWFRGVEKFAPWVRKIWFICDQHPPLWLNLSHPKLNIVNHTDFIPVQYLPAFSANPIELNMYRITGLSEQFVFFNDDMFLISPVKDSLFFQKGLPVDSALLNPIPTTDLKGGSGESKIFTIPLNDAEYLNREFDFRTCMRQNWWKWLHPCYGKKAIRNLVLQIWPRFVGFDEPHLPQAFLKSSFFDAWRENEDILDSTCRHTIRNDSDVNQWFIRQRELAKGRFVPRSPAVGAVYKLNKDYSDAIDAINKQKTKMICLNDGTMEDELFQRVRSELLKVFQNRLPEKSSFEV